MKTSFTLNRPQVAEDFTLQINVGHFGDFEPNELNVNFATKSGSNIDPIRTTIKDLFSV